MANKEKMGGQGGGLRHGGPLLSPDIIPTGGNPEAWDGQVEIVGSAAYVEAKLIRGAYCRKCLSIPLQKGDLTHCPICAAEELKDCHRWHAVNGGPNEVVPGKGFVYCTVCGCRIMFNEYGNWVRDEATKAAGGKCPGRGTK